MDCLAKPDQSRQVDPHLCLELSIDVGRPFVLLLSIKVTKTVPHPFLPCCVYVCVCVVIFCIYICVKDYVYLLCLEFSLNLATKFNASLSGSDKLRLSEVDTSRKENLMLIQIFKFR